MMTGKLIRPAPAEIEFKNMRFLITEQPQDASIHNYIKILKEHAQLPQTEINMIIAKFVAWPWP